MVKAKVSLQKSFVKRPSANTHTNKHTKAKAKVSSPKGPFQKGPLQIGPLERDLWWPFTTRISILMTISSQVSSFWKQAIQHIQLQHIPISQSLSHTHTSSLSCTHHRALLDENNTSQHHQLCHAHTLSSHTLSLTNSSKGPPLDENNASQHHQLSHTLSQRPHIRRSRTLSYTLSLTHSRTHHKAHHWMRTKHLNIMKSLTHALFLSFSLSRTRNSVHHWMTTTHLNITNSLTLSLSLSLTNS